MLRQDFSINSLLKITTKNEIIKFKLGRNEPEYKVSLQAISEYLINEKQIIDNLYCKKERNKIIYSTKSANTHYALKKISVDLKKLYKIEVPHREDISEQIYRIFEQSSNFSIIRLDIKSFYENIKYELILNKINKDKLLSVKSINILKELTKFIDKGLPRGLSISPILSEIFMKDIDNEIKNIKDVYYYARYVDDIIIISPNNYESILQKTIEILSKYNLKTNNKKYFKNIESVDNKKKSISSSFDYLGYKYIIETVSYNKKRIIKAELSDAKKRKIKTRIIHSLLDRIYNTTYSDKEELLIKRLKVLSSNYSITYNDHSKGNLKAGMFYSHRLVNNCGIFSEFNNFLSKSLYCKNNNFFGRAMAQISLSEKANIIKNICFVSGFKDKHFIELEKDEMDRVKRCWKNNRHKRF